MTASSQLRTGKTIEHNLERKEERQAVYDTKGRGTVVTGHGMVLCFDYGSSFIGSAVGLNLSSSKALGPLENTTKISVLHQVDQIVNDYQPKCFVLGSSGLTYPLSLASGFALNIRKLSDLPLFWVNENYSTLQKYKDSFAALLILKSFFRLLTSQTIN